jgi:CRISPR-associated protein Cmr6
MNVAAVPKYVRDSAAGFRNCPPGHRFNLYFEIWQEGNWLITKNGKADALRACLALGDAALVLRALRARQKALAAALPEEQRQIIDAVSTAPFATGLGLEHPVDNGFCFSLTLRPALPRRQRRQGRAAAGGERASRRRRRRSRNR